MEVTSQEGLAPCSEALRAGMERGLSYKALQTMLRRGHGVSVSGLVILRRWGDAEIVSRALATCSPAARGEWEARHLGRRFFV